mmetsp:Transcript_11647/g.24597  ORF Transcript_11647/g.24597 Transcript_11647/m.24597 type:complete len:249 (-) Transcript_11647:133-879(-)
MCKGQKKDRQTTRCDAYCAYLPRVPAPASFLSRPGITDRDLKFDRSMNRNLPRSIIRSFLDPFHAMPCQAKPSQATSPFYSCLFHFTRDVLTEIINFQHSISIQSYLKLQVSETLGFSRVFITNNRHPLDRPAGLKVPQELFGRRAVIHLPHINRCPVAVFRGNPTGGLSVAAVVVGITVGVVSPTLLFLFQIVRFLGDSSGFRLHALDFFLEFFEVFLVVFLRNRFRCFFRGFFAHCSLVFLQYVSG